MNLSHLSKPPTYLCISMLYLKCKGIIILRFSSFLLSKSTVVLIRDQTRSVAKQVSVAVGWVKIEILLMAQLKGLTAKFKLM